VRGLLESFSVCKIQWMRRTYSGCGGGWSKCKKVGGVGVHGGVTAGVGDVPTEGGNLEEECGVGLGVAIKLFMMGKDVA
jgi:hypothetical protein